MSSTTLFLLRFFGPVFLIIGISLLLHTKRYGKMLKELREFSLSYYYAAVMALCTGIAIVLTHNRWDTLPEIAVTLIGWGGLVKGAVRFLAPDVTRTMIDRIVTKDMLVAGGVVVVVWGGYMSWAGFFAA